MNRKWADVITLAKGLSPRQRSLFGILDGAVHAAKHEAGKEGVDIAVIHAPIYVDEFAEGEHVYAPKEAVSAGIIYKERVGIQWAIDAIAAFDGSVFFTRIEDVTVSLSTIPRKERKVDVHLGDSVRCPDHARGGATRCPRGGAELQIWQRQQWERSGQ